MSSTGLALHLDDVRNGLPEVRLTGRAPRVGKLAHRRSRCDRVDRDHLAELVRDPRRGLVAVDADPTGRIGGGLAYVTHGLQGSFSHHQAYRALVAAPQPQKWGLHGFRGSYVDLPPIEVGKVP